MADQDRAVASLTTRSKFVVPNMITATSLVMGLISIFYSYNANYVVASWVILYSVILDKLDGSTARALNASTLFGTEFDSFSDFIAFGCAPAFLVFAICTSDPMVKVAFEKSEHPLFLYISVIFFILASALRLARFNIKAESDSPFMIGVATTVCGAYIASYILTAYKYLDFELSLKLLQNLPYVLMILGALEISNVPVRKFGRRPKKWLRMVDYSVFMLGLVCILTRSFPEVLLFSGTIFIFLALEQYLFHREEIFAQIPAQTSPDDKEETEP